MTEDTTKTRADVTRAYITDATTGAVEFRRHGAVIATMKITDAEHNVRDRLAAEGAIRLYLQGAMIADILDGKVRGRVVVDAVVICGVV